jgi:Putative amidoligase enzyme
MLATRTFGIEIEAFGISLSQARDALSNAGLDCQVEGYHHWHRTYWKVTTDASVPNGFEVVSPVLQGEFGLEQDRPRCVTTGRRQG